MSVSSAWRYPMAAVCGIGFDFLPTAALAVALAIFEETQSLDGLEDEM